MGSLQSRLAYRQANLKRKLFDNRIKLVGQSTNILRLSVIEDDFGNRDFQILSQDIIDGVIKIPGGELILWNQSRPGNNESEGSGIGIYDILPIEAFFKFDDKVEKGDILVYKYILDPISNEYFIQAFQVVNKIGKISNSLLWVKYILTKHTLDLTNYPELQPILDAMKVEPEEEIEQEND